MIKLLQHKRMPEILAVIALLIYLSPNLFFMNHAHYLVHDNLNSNIVLYKMLAESGLVFAPTNALFMNVYNGIPRGCMPSELDYYTLMNLLFSPIMVYNINVILQHVVAFIGMYLLLKDYVYKYSYPYHKVLLSLSFALLPFWPLGELCVAGQPLIIWTFLNLLTGKNSLKYWLLITLFPLFSSDFVYSNLFFSSGLFLFIVVYSFIQKKWMRAPFLAWLLFVCVGLITEYRLLILAVFEHIESQRSNYAFFTGLNWKGYLHSAIFLFLKGQYHFYSNQWWIIIITALIALYLVRTALQRRILGLLIGACLVFSLADSLHNWGGSKVFFHLLGPLTTVQFRFETMFALLWYLIFALSIYFILLRYPKLKAAALAIIAVQVVFLFLAIGNNDYQDSNFPENAFYYSYIDRNNKDHQSFNEYYCPVLMQDIKQKLNYKKENVLCIGFSSEIAQYSGINTAAAYLGYFPASKLQQLINIFLPEINKIPDTLERTEVMHTRTFEFYVHNTSPSSNTISNLKLDTSAMRVMKIRYVCSLNKIENYHQLGLDSIGCSYNGLSTFPKQINLYSFR